MLLRNISLGRPVDSKVGSGGGPWATGHTGPWARGPLRPWACGAEPKLPSGALPRAPQRDFMQNRVIVTSNGAVWAWFVTKQDSLSESLSGPRAELFRNISFETVVDDTAQILETTVLEPCVRVNPETPV